MSGQNKSTFENINDLLKAILWPLLILLLFFIYKSEISYIIKLIPKKFESSTKISIGSLSMEIDKTAEKYGNLELASIIKNLSDDGIRKLLNFGAGPKGLISYSFIGNNNNEKNYFFPEDYDALVELEKNGLVEGNEPLDKFLSFFKDLNPDEKVWYKGINENFSSVKDDSHNKKVVQLSVLSTKLNLDQIDKLEHYTIGLSESGKKAFDIIVHVVSEQINRN